MKHLHRCPDCSTFWKCEHPECRPLKRPSLAFCPRCDVTCDDRIADAIASAVVADALSNMELDVENFRFCIDATGDFAESRSDWCAQAGIDPNAFREEARKRHNAFMRMRNVDRRAARIMGRRMYGVAA